MREFLFFSLILVAFLAAGVLAERTAEGAGVDLRTQCAAIAADDVDSETSAE